LANLNVLDMTRHVHYLIDKGMSSSEALQRIEDTKLATSTQELENIRGLFIAGEGNETVSSGYTYRNTLKKLMDSADGQGGDRSKIFTGFYNNYVRNKADFDLSIFDVSGLLFYLISIVSVATICVAIYSVFVLPEFENLFVGFGHELPPLTAIILTITRDYGAIVIGVVVLFILGIFLTVVHVKNTLKSLRYFSSTIIRLPIIGKIANEFNQFLQLGFIQLMIYSGVEPRRAIDEIGNKFGDSLRLNGEHGAAAVSENLALKMALELETFPEEIEYQLAELKLKGVNDFSKVKSIISVVAIITVALAVGSVIIAMYLPIFQMGRIIG